jgi:hypothetical protein
MPKEFFLILPSRIPKSNNLINEFFIIYSKINESPT